ncbi:unnamed protein product, partial [Gongylonema pulchrum]|uniref:USP7_ICP0_bdg domain-containing protein n=1 Tax=Gongylonema pulchrum TaxID=637853 RepID=A0A183D4B0_9BILA
MRIHIHTRIHTYIHIYVRTYTHIRTAEDRRSGHSYGRLHNDNLDYLLQLVVLIFPFLEDFFTDDMMFFLKYYDADEKATFFCGHVMINYKSTIRSYLPQILQKARLPLDTELKFYEEIAPERMRPLCVDDIISQDHTVVDLVDGALLVFERADKSTTENNAHLYYTTKYNTMLVEALQNPEGFGTPLIEQFDPVMGEISQTWTMGQLMQWIAAGIGCSADHILLWK